MNAPTIQWIKRLKPLGLLVALAILLTACAADSEPSRPTQTPTTGAAETQASTATATLPPPATSTATTEPEATQAAQPAEPTPPAPAFDPQTVSVALETALSGLDRPLFLTHAGDDRLFVLEKPGRILVFVNGRESPEVFLDIRDRVGSSGSEQGLLGLAFPPNYAQSGFFFVDYTDRQGDTVVSRFQIGENANQANAESEFVILHLDQPAANHNGGMLAFGPDGYFYVGMGDGGAANDRFNNGQNPQTLLGTLLRLDVTSDPSQPYQIPADNPWIDATWNGQEVRDEIWAIGLRNPWRYSFDRATRELWIGDVGQNKYEEIDRVSGSDLAGGLNFGWPRMEGNHCFPDNGDCDASGLVLPIVDYSHAETGGCSVTGGYVYRGQRYPALSGIYFYGDFCSGSIWALWQDEAGDFQHDLVLQTDAGISSFGEDVDGELYVTDLSGGQVYRLTATTRP